jgi:hypothetical protein
LRNGGELTRGGAAKLAQGRFVLTRRLTVAQELPAQVGFLVVPFKATDGRRPATEKRRKTPMPYLHANCTGNGHQRSSDEVAIDTLLIDIDNEFDDDLDRHVSAIRESLPDFRNYY